MQVAFRQYPTSEGHIIKVKVEYQGYISQTMAVSGALVFHKQILLDMTLLPLYYTNSEF